MRFYSFRRTIVRIYAHLQVISLYTNKMGAQTVVSLQHRPFFTVTDPDCMRILFITEGTHAPSSRFRVQQFLPHFRRSGITCHVVAGYGPRYNEISKTRWSAAYKLATRTQSFVRSLNAQRYDLIFVQRPILPFTALPETLLHRLNSHMIFDVDDAVFLGANSQPAPLKRRTFERCVQLSTHYIAGNDFLAHHGKAPHKTHVIPTVIDTDVYRPDPAAPKDESQVVIGWIGSPTTLRYVDQVLPALRAVRDRYPHVIVRIVCSHMPKHLAQERRFEFVPWSKETEIASIQSFDIGIMPMEDTLISQGKCGFKMIQYMGTGVSVVSSPVGANAAIFEGSNAGALANTHNEWVHALSQLIEDSTHRQSCAENARKHAVKNYSVHAVLPQYLDIFDSMG